jgi:heavy metal translocating P-type ATPase
VAVGAVIAVNSMTVSLAVNTSDTTAGERAAIHGVLLALAVAGLAILGWPLARNALRAARARRITIEAMFLSGVVGAFTASVVASITGTGHVYFEIVTIMLVVYAFGQQLTASAQEKALRAATRWAPAATECTLVHADGHTEQVPVSGIRAGDRVLAPPGSLIAVDGTVESGEAFVREAEMTGELFAVVRRPGDRVWAGTACVDASLVVRATADGGRRRIDSILDAVEKARRVPSTLQSQADRLVGVFLPLVLSIAVLTFLGWTVAAGWERGLFNAMAVLLVACPCALGLATPLAVWAAVGRLASRGLVVRGGDAVEELAAVDAVVFDKTGTLTEPRPTLVDLVVDGEQGVGRHEVLRMVRALESESRHPLAAAFVADGESGEAGLAVTDHRILPAAGVAGTIVEPESGRRRELQVGAAARLAEAAGPAWDRLAERLRAPEAAHRLAVVLEGRLVAAAAVDERLRGSWPQTLRQLRDDGVLTVVMTGDVAARARMAAADRVASEMSPEDKLEAVRALRRDGRRVLFVGDGVNDAAAMAASDVSIGVAGGAELAAEVAGIAWHGEDLRVVAWALELARGTVRTIRGNLRLAAAYNAAGVALAAGGVLHPVAAALLMTCSSLVVTWRATSVLQESEEEAAAGAATGETWAPAPVGRRTT